jgi:membrane fusion protein, multidrug efflux system
MVKKLILGLVGVLVALPIVGALVGIKMLQFQAMGANAAKMATMIPPTKVTVAEVRADSLHPRLASVGSVVAVQGVTVSTEADGTVRNIAFEAGAMVNAGDVLLTLDTEVEEAQLRAAEATAEWARVSFKRAQELLASRTISQAELDSADAEVKQAEANADNIRAVIAKKNVRAPFAGRLGIRRISVGQYLNRGSPIVSLHSLDPVFVEFSLPQQRLGEVNEGLNVEVTSDAYADQTFEGKVTAVNPDVDSATRNVRLQATLANPEGRLRPGMFVSIGLILERSENVLLIPATAVLHAPYGDSVYVVAEGEAGAEGKKPLVVNQQPVRLGARYGDFVVVNEGVKAGDKLVSSGVFKLRPKMPVEIDNTLAPEAQLQPKPSNT